MFKTEEPIVRCKCGRELTNPRTFLDTKTGRRFLTERCEACREIVVMLADEGPAVSR
ncbi:hypothetical protein ACFFWD_35465 [Bradyrhizobium erythrophlei]|uniref:hypothetical protein n=1 Tax=Bradyrhizobium erythrophlei TaxID=1437360 RepID=UPI0035E91B7C